MIYSTGNKYHSYYISMRKLIQRVFLFIICLTVYTSLFSQENSGNGSSVFDSLNTRGLIMNQTRKRPEIVLNKNQSVRFLQQMTQSQKWNDSRDPLRQALNQLIYEASHPVFDSAGYFLKKYPYDSLDISWDKFYIWEPVKLKVPVISEQENTITGDSLIRKASVSVASAADTSFDKIMEANDTLKKEQLTVFKDTTLLVIIDTLNEVTSNVPGFPFRYLNFPYQSDSVMVAVKSLLEYLEERDSTEVKFTGLGDSKIPVWMNSKSRDAVRYWLKNELNDSVTVWIANQSRNSFGLYLENGVSFRRPGKQGNYSEARIDVQKLDNSKLQNVQKIAVKPQYWKYRTEAAFVFSQSALTNWVKGGENSISSLLDITGYADYNNKPLKISSNNFARIKLGFLKSGDNPVRKNVDLIETNSKLNHRAFGKFDFSAIMLFKTQLAPGYSYVKINDKDTAIMVSKMFNPATLTIGFGLDYKPNKKTSINFSPFSYKGTYMTDTANIDQTKYGIPHNRKSLNEPGASFMISNEFKPTKNISITNRLQLFTNYIHNPMNIDVDWEMIGVVNLNWFTDIRFNTHLIFDDDTKTVELDDDKQPVYRPDGTLKKTARVQFKEMLGLSLVFRF
jgi:hypothetical protein